ncbi:MAG: protoporphyrinogen oxidase HemJ [Alphaproteobacteria bacterium]|nr:protoporphyrinogen oxidase HemJ [Alphaproteobacteria bacterium]MDG1887913.1 protoporphyrinogen oxidase HemJ [Alphaproteobacteria bacterium]
MDYYHWIKAAHLISVIAWMVGLLYLPRLFVYHSMEDVGSDASAIFKTMERRLLRFIMNPAMLASFGFGIWMLLVNPELLEESWMQWKILLLVGMTGVHALLSRWRRFFDNDANTWSPRFFKIINEVPTVLMIGIIILAVVKL